MVRFIGRFEYASILIGSALFSGIFTFIVLSMSSLERKIVGVFIVPAIFTLIFTALVYFSLRKAKIESGKRAKYTVIVFIMSYIFFESIMTIITVHTMETILLLIPMNLIFMSIPIYLKFNRKSTMLDHAEYSPELTETIKAVLGGNAPEIYIIDRPGMAMATTTDGDNWKIIIFKHALEDLNPEELEMLMLENYFRRTGKSMKRFLLIAFSFFTAIIDCFILTYLIAMAVSAAYAPYIIGTQFMLILLIVTYPIIISRMFIKNNGNTDKKVLSTIDNKVAFISLIQKENSYDPNTTMTKYQYLRFKERQKRNIERRIKNLDEIN
jgi:hypothetical protein